MSNNNFKDDFEKNRQSINPDEHQRDLKEDDKTNENNKEVDNFHQEMHNDEKDAERQLQIKANIKTTSIKKIVTLKLQKVH